MQKIKKYLIILIFAALPVFAFADGLVPCGGNTEPACDFTSLMTLINGLITFVLTKMAIPIAAIMFVYAGILLVGSGGSTESMGKAKKIFTNTVIGLIIAVACWVIVKLVLSIMGFDGGWIGF